MDFQPSMKITTGLDDDCVWFRTAAESLSLKPLETELHCDIAIVGAGYTGLTTALRIAEKGQDVIDEEAHEVR